MRTSWPVTALFTTLLGACATEDVDGVDDSFATDGKADSALSDRQRDAVLRTANQASLATLDDEVGLSAQAARNLVTWRDGADLQPGTDDDRRFFSLDEVDGVRYVGPVAFDKLLAYALDHDPDPTGSGGLQLRIEEVNFGSGTHHAQRIVTTPSAEFGARIERGNLVLRASDDSPAVDLGITVWSSPRIRLPLQLDVSAEEMAAGLTVEGIGYYSQGGGSIAIQGCPSLGTSVRAQLGGVRLRENAVGYSIKMVYGTADLQVVADDGTLFCR